jgi:excisionase family DNA binding protein
MIETQHPALTLTCPNDGHGLLTAEQVAECLGISVRMVYELTRQGRIPHVKLGRYYRYRPEAIEAWLIENERGTVSPTNQMAAHRSHGRRPAQEA